MKKRKKYEHNGMLSESKPKKPTNKFVVPSCKDNAKVPKEKAVNFVNWIFKKKSKSKSQYFEPYFNYSEFEQR